MKNESLNVRFMKERMVGKVAVILVASEIARTIRIGMARVQTGETGVVFTCQVNSFGG